MLLEWKYKRLLGDFDPLDTNASNDLEDSVSVRILFFLEDLEYGAAEQQDWRSSSMLSAVWREL